MQYSIYNNKEGQGKEKGVSSKTQWNEIKNKTCEVKWSYSLATINNSTKQKVLYIMFNIASLIFHIPTLRVASTKLDCSAPPTELEDEHW